MEITILIPISLRIVGLKKSNLCESHFLGVVVELPCWLVAIIVLIL